MSSSWHLSSVLHATKELLPSHLLLQECVSDHVVCLDDNDSAKVEEFSKCSHERVVWKSGNM
jgi:hypothetical protein